MINNLKIDEVYETIIESLENEGNGVCKINGMVVFVPKALPGEKVLVRITDVKKNFAKGKIYELIKESDKRVKPNCPYYDECGGCNLRHQDKKANIEFKKSKVENALKRIGKIDAKVEDVVTCKKEDNYRNKASFKVEDNKIGFYRENTYQLINIEECKLLEPEINKALNYIRSYLESNNNEIKTITIKLGNALNELLIDINSLDDNDIKIIDYLLDNLVNLKTVVFNSKIVYGNGYISQVINNLMFNCSSKSFFQVNDKQAEKLYDIAIKEAEVTSEDVVLDLYSGTGTITNLVALYAKKVIGIEIVEDAVKDAISNAKLNNISNTSFICGDAGVKIKDIKEKIDIIFIDPPRKGLDKKAIDIIKKMNPKKVIYISCNPVTMARDLNLLNDMYDVKKVIPVDMFVNTSHVECISILKKLDL